MPKRKRHLPFTSHSEAQRCVSQLAALAEAHLDHLERRLRHPHPTARNDIKRTRAALNQLLREHYGK